MKSELNIKISITKITDILLNQINSISQWIQFSKSEILILISPENIDKRSINKINSICN